MSSSQVIFSVPQTANSRLFMQHENCRVIVLKKPSALVAPLLPTRLSMTVELRVLSHGWRDAVEPCTPAIRGFVNLS